MTSTHKQSDDQHIRAVLEPIKPSSRYEFVEIEQETIPFSSPIARVGRMLRSTIDGIAWIVRTQWKMLALVALIVIGAEFAARAIEPRLMNRVYDATMTGGYPKSINSQGFRGDPVAMSKPDTTRRVLALGDSVTFGTGISADKTWPSQLQSILDKDNSRVEVINAGLPALDLGQIELELHSRWIDLDPDEAVVMLTGNMISFAYARKDREQIKPPKAKSRAEMPAEATKTAKDRAKDLYTSLALPGVLTIGMEHLKYAVGLESHAVDPSFPAGVMLAHGYTQQGIDQTMIDEAWEEFGAQLATLKATCDELDLPLTVIYSPPRFAISDARSDNTKWVNKDRFTIDPIERTRDLCAQLGLSFIDPSDALRKAPSPAYTLSDYTHFDEHGGRVIAELIATEITNP